MAVRSTSSRTTVSEFFANDGSYVRAAKSIVSMVTP